MENRTIENWMDAYLLAWKTPGTDLLKEIFTEEISYSPGPFKETIRGLPALATFWEEARDAGELFEMTYELVATEGDIVVMKTKVTYADPHNEHWKNIWIMQFENDGRCFSFEEWPYAPGTRHAQK